MGHSRSRFRGTHLGVLLAYILLALLLTFPLVTKLATHVAGDGIDAPPLAWNLWWVKSALVDIGTNPLASDYLFYPVGINLAFYTLTVLNGVLSIPLQSIFGLIVVNNLVLLSSFVLSGWGAFLLIEHLLAVTVPGRLAKQSTRRLVDPVRLIHLAAFVGGLVYAFSSSKLFFAALGQFNIASSQWVPFYILFLFKLRQNPQSFRFPILLALFLLLQTWAEMTYASFLILFTVFFFFYHLVSAPASRALYGFVRAGLIAAVIFAIGIAPILMMMLPDLAAEGDIFVEGTGFAETFSSDILGLVVPTQLHPLMGNLVNHLGFPHDKGQHLFMGFVTLALAGCGLIRWANRGLIRFWGLVTIVFLVLSWGPVARFNGTGLGVPLPFQLLQRVPFFNGNRYPGRMSVMVLIGVAVLVGFGTVSFLRYFAAAKRKHLLLAAAACILLLSFEHLSVPLPLTDLRLPEVYSQIAADTREVTVLDIPVAWRNGFRVTGTMDPIIMLEQFAQTVHGKKILAGNTSRNPEYKFQYFTELPVINSIIALETGHSLEPGRTEADRMLAEPLLSFLNIQYILIHPNEAGEEVIRYIEAIMPVDRFYQDETTIAYRVNLREIEPEVYIDLGTPLAAANLGEGWGEAYVTDGYVWAQRDGASLMVPLDGRAQKMSFRVWAPGARQVLRIDINGHALPALELAEGWGEYELALPAVHVHDGLNRIRLRFSRLFPAGSVLPEGSPLGQSNIGVPVNILAKSAGHEVGNFGHIYLNGRNVSLEGTGYNMVALDPATGALLDRQVFNTFSSERASQDMARWIDALPDETVVVVAVKDEASMHLTEEAVQALHTLGLEEDLRERFRWGHAAIGAKGLEQGKGLESADLLGPATVKLGLGVTEPRVAAAFDWVRFLPADADVP